MNLDLKFIEEANLNRDMSLSVYNSNSLDYFYVILGSDIDLIHKDIPLYDQLVDYENNESLETLEYYRSRYNELKLVEKLQKLTKDSYVPNRDLAFGGYNFACYGNFLTKIDPYIKKNKGVSRFFLELNIGTDPKTSQNNYTWMTEEQLREHINYPREVLDIDFKYKIVTIPEKKLYKVLLDFDTRLSKLKIKFVLFWIRYAFEMPSQLALFDAYYLKKYVFPKEELYNLLLMASFMVSNVYLYKINDSQCISIDGHMITREALKKRLNYPSRHNDKVTQLFFGNRLFDYQLLPPYPHPNKIETSGGSKVLIRNGIFIFLTSSRWLREDVIEERVKNYKFLYRYYWLKKVRTLGWAWKRAIRE